MGKEVFLISEMHMGGAERIMSVLANYCADHGRDTTVILTHQSLGDANLSRLNQNVKVISLVDEVKKVETKRRPAERQMLIARFEGKLSKIFGTQMADAASVRKFYSRNYDRVHWLKNFFSQNPKAAAIAFLYDSIFLTLLSVTKSNKVIISDRGDPQQSVSSKTDMAFFRRMFPKADQMVFQSPGVQDWYKTNIGLGGKIIFNPIKDNLPKPYTGKRKKRIVNFCRIDPQKNLFLLLESFEKLAKECPDYELYIYGDRSENAREYSENFLQAANNSMFSERIHIHPARADIHEEILDCAMFVSSSDFEGMSNSMLEAMAIGLPTICTDCPAGGARAVIRDHENGLLVPVNDAEALYLAMKEVVDNPELAESLSRNGRRIRQEQSAEIIMKQWMELING